MKTLVLSGPERSPFVRWTHRWAKCMIVRQMIRKAFVMSVNVGAEQEYERRHQPIWPELEETLLAHGVRTYSIFLLPETRQLFAYVEFKNETQWNAIAQTEVCQRWWKHMRDVMPANPDNSPVSTELREVFHIENVPSSPLKQPVH